MSIFIRNKRYSLQEIINICDKNKLVTVDCLKDENMVSVEKYNNGELGDCIYEFIQLKDSALQLASVDKNYL